MIAATDDESSSDGCFTYTQPHIVGLKLSACLLAKVLPQLHLTRPTCKKAQELYLETPLTSNIHQWIKRTYQRHLLLGVTLVLDQPLKRKLTIKLTLNGKLWHEESFGAGLVDFECELDSVLTLQSGSNLSILYTRKNRLGVPVPIAKASVLFRDAQQLIANGTGKLSAY
ncbi:hypothetical protein EW146_g9831 [Bondarzewia mesenterica]|uniref:Uncharacterized protein n=1 Tax=Bondarzewia mesenterica TaxID=1095465 RepID=A0A4S4L7R7_9AGAM|nr:hypothetical protein EW146_g9831 [Bondarzewia mesenterica]